VNKIAQHKYGKTYTEGRPSHHYKLHKRHGVICSMADGYDCYQNALAERINGILKMEYLLVKPEDIEQARKMVKESVEIYNTQRPHRAF